jgi:hypothetical protein
MSNLSNYPPGVTGNEYAISGAQKEWEEKTECSLCGKEDIMLHEYHYEFGERYFCTNADCTGSDTGVEVEYDYAEDDFKFDEMRENRFYG